MFWTKGGNLWTPSNTFLMQLLDKLTCFVCHIVYSAIRNNKNKVDKRKAIQVVSKGWTPTWGDQGGSSRQLWYICLLIDSNVCKRLLLLTGESGIGRKAGEIPGVERRLIRQKWIEVGCIVCTNSYILNWKSWTASIYINVPSVGFRLSRYLALPTFCSWRWMTRHRTTENAINTQEVESRLM